MNLDELTVRRGIVLASALIYWGGVWIQARRVRRHIGRSPNLRPKGIKERVLWLGWMLVVAGWIALPFLVKQTPPAFILIQLQSEMLHPAGLALGLALVAAGYAGTLWCYKAMGDHWRIGIDPTEKNSLVTRGPYGVVRHPIYLFQIVMLAGSTVLLPSWSAVLILALHLICVLCKAMDEEAYLARTHGDAYRAYLSRTGRLLPRFGSRRS